MAATTPGHLPAVSTSALLPPSHTQSNTSPPPPILLTPPMQVDPTIPPIRQPSIPSYPSLSSFHHKRVTADRLDKLDRIFTAGLEGKPGVRMQIGFEPTLHATMHGYSSSLPSAPSPPPTAHHGGEEPAIPKPMSPQSVSADGVRCFPSPLFSPFPPPAEEKQKPPTQPPSSQPSPAFPSFLPPPHSSHLPFPHPLPLPFPPAPPSPTTASPAPPDAEPDPDPSIPPPQQRNTLLHYWQSSAPIAGRSSSGVRVEEVGEEDIVEIIEEGERKGRSTPASAKCVAGQKRKQMDKQSTREDSRVREALEKREAEAKELQARLDAAQQQLKEQERVAQRALDAAHEQHAHSERATAGELERYRGKVQHELLPLLRESALLRRAEAERQLLLDQSEVGRMVSVANGMSVTEHWMESERVKDTQKRLRTLQEEEERISDERQRSRRKAATLKMRQKKAEGSREAPPLTPSPVAPEGVGDNGGFVKPAPVELVDDDFYSVRLRDVRVEMAELMERLASLQVKKAQVMRASKLKADELNSRFCIGEALHGGRYLLTELLGKGGFSEVFKAYDLTELRHVAIKVHQLNPAWSAERRSNYIKHAEREYDIHRGLEHPAVVKLLDVFGLSKERGGGGDRGGKEGCDGGGECVEQYGFATVLEYCNGADLDFHLKQRGVLSEKEARVIIRQLFRALQYLTQHSRRIIHYDLKPGNLLFHNHHIKITDFGLSKILSEAGDATSMELTSQGAGTYWYLPPECFPESSSSPTLPPPSPSSSHHLHPPSGPMISSKVDIFSAGVILYQMLTGRKPFGHGQSPHVLVRDSIMRNADGGGVDWKGWGGSPVTMQFVQRCLSREPSRRPDIDKVFEDPFFAATFKEEGGHGGGAGGKRKKAETAK